MNFDHLTDDEFVVRCLTDSTDPGVQRLCRIINNYQEVLGDIQRFKNFTDDYTIEGRTIGEHINFLENEIEYFHGELEIVREKADRLSIRTVPDLIADLSSKYKDAESRARRAEAAERELSSKLETWNILAR